MRPILQVFIVHLLAAALLWHVLPVLAVAPGKGNALQKPAPPPDTLLSRPPFEENPDTFHTDRGINLRWTDPAGFRVSGVAAGTGLNVKVGDELTEIDGRSVAGLNRKQAKDALLYGEVMLTIRSGKSETTFSCHARIANGAPSLPQPADVSPVRPPLTRAMGNIGPYRKGLLLRLSQNWHPRKANIDVVLKITIGHDGDLLSAEIAQSSGNRNIDGEALEAVQRTAFAFLPDWVKEDELTFKIELTNVGATQGNSPSSPAPSYIPYTGEFAGKSKIGIFPEEIADAVLHKVKGNWTIAEGPVLLFTISHDPAAITVAKSSGDSQLDDKAVRVLSSLHLPSLDSEHSVVTFTIDLATKAMSHPERHRI